MRLTTRAAAGMMLSAIISCTTDGGGVTPDIPQPEPPVSVKKEMRISTSVDPVARVTDTQFETGDCIGLYVVNRTGDGTLRNLGNHVDNMRFAFSGTWTPDTPVYWLDDNTHADLYVYYPYRKDIGDVRAVGVEVPADQSTPEAYKAGEVLTGAATDVAPTETAVAVTMRHAMSRMMIDVTPGNGFTAGQLADAAVKVTVNGLKTAAVLDIAQGTVTAAGDAKTITPLLSDGTYQALVVPQAVEECNLITVNIDGTDYNLKKAFVFEAGKSHWFSVAVSRTSSGINVNIDGWETDGTDNGGVAE